MKMCNDSLGFTTSCSGFAKPIVATEPATMANIITLIGNLPSGIRSSTDITDPLHLVDVLTSIYILHPFNANTLHCTTLFYNSCKFRCEESGPQCLPKPPHPSVNAHNQNIAHNLFGDLAPSSEAKQPGFLRRYVGASGEGCRTF